jgi:hypothetical protein
LQEVHLYRDEPDEQLVEEFREVGFTHFVSLPLSESHLDPSARLGVGVASRYPVSQRDRHWKRSPRAGPMGIPRSPRRPRGVYILRQRVRQTNNSSPS